MRLGEGATAFRQRIIERDSSREGIEAQDDLVARVVVSRPDTSDNPKRLKRQAAPLIAQCRGCGPEVGTNAWLIDSVGREEEGANERVEHPTQKPVELFTRPITCHTKPGELCYEPFAGSGTALITAEVTGRICYALELEPARPPSGLPARVRRPEWRCSAGTCNRMPHHATPEPLSPKQRRAVEALLATGEVAAAAREAGINRSTLYRWLKERAFLSAVRAAESEALDELSRLLVRLGRTAVATIAKAMSDPVTPVATKVRAADVALGRFLQLRELAQLEARVQTLEQSAGIDQGRRP
jgi:transposase-like protein